MLILRCGGLQIHRTPRRTSSGTGANMFTELTYVFLHHLIYYEYQAYHHVWK